MNNELKILVKAVFDDSQKSINELNNQLKQLQNKIDQLELKIHIDEKTIKTINDLSKVMGNHKQTMQSLNKAYKEEEQVIKNTDGIIEKINRKYLQSGEIIEKTTKIIDKRKQALQQEANALEQQNKALEKTILNQNKLQKVTVNKDGQGNIKNKTEQFKDNFTDITYRYDRQGNLNNEKITINLEQQRKATEDLINSKRKLKQELTQLSNEGKVSAENLAKLNKAIDNSKNIQQIQRLEQHLQNLNRIRENEHKLELTRQQALLNAQRIKTTHGGFVDNRALQQYIDSINNLTPRTVNLNQQLQKTDMQFKQIAQNAKSAAGAAQQAGMSFAEMMSTAMVKFPIWMISATAFYAPIRAMEDIVSRLVEIDTLLVDINRVMDIPDFKLTELLNEAVNVSDQLSSKLTDVLKIMGDFGRMGFEENQLVDITKTAQVLQNISDLDTTAAVDTLTSAMLNFNIAAADSIKIADQLNEVDNNFAISTKDLSDGLRKSASTAKIFGVELSDLIGYIAAIGSATRESGSIIGNGLKTIISRITTMSEAESILNSVNISIRDMSGNIRPVSDILEELAGKWMTLSDEQRQNIGVTLAGRYQLSRFLALMNNWNLAVEASETALNSQGSAMREQIKYADSLEARLNRLDTAWNKVVLSVSSAVVTDGFIATVETLNDIATVSSFMIDKVGLLSGVFGTLGAATVLLSTRFRTFTSSLIFGTEGMTSAQLAAAGLTAGMSRLGIATAGATAALRGFAASTIVGLIFAVIGFALEKLIKLYSDAKQKQEEFEQSQQKNIEALTTNKEKTEELIASYKALSAEKENGQWDNEKEKEYLRIQQQLGEIFPNLISHIDSTGQYHLKSANAIDKEVEATKELIKLKQEEIKLSALKNFEDNIDKIDGFFGLEKQVERKRKQVKELEKIGADPLYINKMQQELRRLESEFATASMKINDEVLKVANAYNKLEINPEIRKSVQDFVSSLDLTKLNPQELESFSIKIASLTDKMQKAYESGNESAFNKATKALMDHVSQMGATNNQANSLDVTLEKVKKRNEQLANAVYAAADGMDVMADSMSDVVENGEQATSIYDRLNKKYQETSDKVAVLNKLMEDVANGKQISAVAAMELIQKEHELAKAISIENGMIKVNVDAVVKLRDAKIKAYADMNKAVEQALINEANAIVRKIYGYKQEVVAIQSVADAKRKLAEIKNDVREEFASGNIQIAIPMLGRIRQLKSIIESLEQLDQISKLASQSLTQVGTSQEKLSESQEKSNKETEYSTYIADKYKQQLEKVNIELEKINAIKSKFSQHSKEYQKALKQEIELLKQQKKIYEDQQKDLQRQIASGKIQQTGIITQKSTPKSSYAGQYADIINKAAQTYGVDPALIAAVIKQESNFNPKAKSRAGAKGLMQLMPSTARELGVTNVYDPYQNIMGGTKYLAQQLERFNGNIELALAAYNAGPGNVKKYGGIPPFKEVQNYIKKVTQNYRDYSGTKTIDASDVSRQKAEAQQAIDEARSQLLQIQGEITNINAEIIKLHEQLVDSFVAEYDYAINYIQNKVKEYEIKAKSLDSPSEAYRSTINEQAYQLTMLNKKLNDEIWFLRHQAKNNKNISPQKREELFTLAKEKEFERMENKLRIQELLFEKINSRLRRYSDQIDDLNYRLDRSTKIMSIYEEGSEEWNKELQIQKQLLQEKAQILLKEQEIIRKSMRNNKLSIEQQKELQEALEETSLAYWDVIVAQEELIKKEKQVRDQLANQLIDTIKKSYQKEKEFALEAIDKEMEALEKAHEEKRKLYEEDLNNFEETIRRKMQLIDRQTEEEDYNKQLNKLQQEELKIRKRISILSIDDSKEAQSKRIELEEELKNITEQIEELKTNRERDLRKQNLEEQAEQYRKEIEEKMEAEEQKYEIEKERLEKTKRETEFHYNNLINDEKYYAKMRKDIIAGNFEEIKGIMQHFYDEMRLKNEETVKGMGEEWAELTNLIHEITSGQEQITNLENAEKDIQMVLDWQKYLGNKRKYDLSESAQERQKLAAENTKLRKKYGFIDGSYEELLDVRSTNKEELRQVAWKKYLNNKKIYNLQKTKEGREKLRKENEELRRFWGFPDGSYNQLKNLKTYHEGGVVGQNDNSLARTFRKLMDLKPNEQIVKALKGELMIPPLKIPNFMSNIQSLSPTLVTPSGSVANYHLTINIDQFTGSKKEVDNLSTTIINNLKKMGCI